LRTWCVVALPAVSGQSPTDSVSPVRRTIAALITSALLVAACGNDTDDNTSEPADSASPDAASAPSVSGEPTETETAPTFEDVGPPPTSPAKPAVDIPSDLPTALEKNVLVAGEGPAAESGDTVVVDYIGVRSSDGVEFDNSYDRFQPFPVTLGGGGVIQGWDQGLVGVQAGERLQLDIPSDLAYGAEARDDVIGADEALTFVIDVRSVIEKSDPADKPTDPGVPPSEGATEVATVDVVEGEGAKLVEGQTAVVDFVLYRGDNLVELESNWGIEPLQIVVAETGNLDGLIQGMVGMRVGGLRAITIPPDLAFGAEGNPQGGLPADTDIIILAELLGAY
jgi:FKBP-type peptidyl-prolyl cis-trans isomerase